MLTYANPTGRLPVVQFSNQRRENELFGRPFTTPCCRTLANTTRSSQAVGRRDVHGNPIPVLEGNGEHADTVGCPIQRRTASVPDPFGVLVTAPQVAFDMNGLLFVGKGGSANFSHRRSVSAKTSATCFISFDPRNRSCGLARVLWGQSVTRPAPRPEVQLPPLSDWSTRSASCSWFWALTKKATCRASGGPVSGHRLWLRMRSLVDPQILVAQTKATG